MRVGISIITVQGFNIWNNGIGQNVYHLASLIEKIPFVERVFLINTGDQDYHPGSTGEIGERYPLVPLKESADMLDVAIELSGGLDVEWISRFRARGGKVVYHNCGQPYSALVEPTIFNKPSFFSDAQRCDAVWQLPKDEIFNSMMGAIHRCPVEIVPYIWAPTFLDKSIADIVSTDVRFGYVPGSLANAVPSIFEPNLSPIKIGLIPFMICEAVNREDPTLLKHVNLLNASHLAKHQTLYQLVSNSTVYKTSKISITARDFFALVMIRGSNMVVSHQINCPQNYLYLDTIYGNYPLIHNSELFKSVGYYYPDSDIDEGARQIKLAIEHHDRNLDYHEQRNREMIESVSPLNRANRDAYARHLLRVAGGTSSASRQGRA